MSTEADQVHAPPTDGLSGVRGSRSLGQRPLDLGLPPGVDCAALDGGRGVLQAVGGECQWDGRAFVPDVAALGGDGEKRLFVRAVDEAGNASESDVVALQLDQTAPTTPCFLAGCAEPPTRFTAATSVTLEVRAPSLDRHPRSLQACVDTGATCSCAFDDVPGSTFTVAVPANTTSVVCVRAVDEADNASEADRATVVHDDQAPAAPTFTLPLEEVTGASTLLLFRAPYPAVADPTFSHFTVIGGGHPDVRRLCPAASEPFCPVADVDRFFVDTDGRAVAVTVDLNPEAVNTLQLKAVDRAGNESGVTVVSLREGSLVAARSVLLRANEGQMVALGDRVAFTVDDRSSDTSDEGRLLDPGLDLRLGSDDDRFLVFSSTVQVMNEVAAGFAFDDVARQSASVSGSPSGVVWIDGGANVAGALSGALRLRTTGSDTAFDDGNDVTLTLSPFPSGCGQQLGFRNPSMSRDRIAVSCIADAGNTDIYLIAPGPDGVYSDSGSVARDDVFVPLGDDPVLREHTPALSRESAAWWREGADGRFDLLVRQGGDDGTLGTSDDRAVVVETGVAAEVAIAPGLYVPGDVTVPSCQQGLVFADRRSRLLFQSAGDDGLFVSADDPPPVVLEDGVLNLIGGVPGGAPGNLAKLQIGPGVIAYKSGALNSEVVRSTGPDRCFGTGDDVLVSELTSSASRDIAVGPAGWFEFRTPGILGNSIVFHDLLTRRALSSSVTFGAASIAAGDGYLAAASTGFAVVYDTDDRVVRSTRNDAFVRSLRSAGAALATSDEFTDTLTLFQPGPDGALLTGDDVPVVIAADALGDELRDDTIDSQQHFAATERLVAWFTGRDTSNAPVEVRLQSAGANGVFELVSTDDCEATVTTTAVDRGGLTAAGTTVAWVDVNASLSAGALQVFEPATAANPCAAGGTITELTGGTSAPVVARVRSPVLVGNRIVALETTAGGAVTNLALFEAPRGSFADGFVKERLCAMPTAWSAAVDDFTLSHGLTLLEGYAVFAVELGGLRKTLACDLGNGTLHLIDANQPGPVALSSGRRSLAVLSALDGSIFEYALER